jgi:large subunit ribosomal protein L25
MRVFKDAGATTLVTLHVGDEKHPVLIHSVQRDYLSNTVMHVDFYEVSLTEAIRAKVPLEFVGEAPAVKEQGGILNKAVADLEVEALPDKLPHRIFVPLERLRDLNQSLYVRDLEIPKDVTVLAEPETVVVTVTLPLAEEEQPAAPVDVATVKVEAEEKKAKRAQERDVQGKEAA